MNTWHRVTCRLTGAWGCYFPPSSVLLFALKENLERCTLRLGQGQVSQKPDTVPSGDLDG